MLTSPLMLVSIMRCQSSRSALCAGPLPKAKPALLISTLGVSKRGGRELTLCSMACRSVMSSSAIWVGTVLPRRCCKASRRSRRRPVRTRPQPAAANASAQASPIPDVAPVINTMGVVSCIMNSPVGNTVSKRVEQGLGISHWSHALADTGRTDPGRNKNGEASYLAKAAFIKADLSITRACFKISQASTLASHNDNVQENTHAQVIACHAGGTWHVERSARACQQHRDTSQ